MRRHLVSASGIVVSTREAARLLVEAFPELADRPLAIGPVGWDRRDFAGAVAARRDDAFRIVHTGYLHTELGRQQRRSEWARRWLGGARDEWSILARSHVHLLDALQRLLDRRPELRGRIELHLAGVQSPADQDVSAGSVDVRWLGYLDHPDAVADALRRSPVSPMHDLPPGHRATIVPGKTYEYLASGRPILAAVPDGDARDILAEAGSALLCRPTDEGEMAAILSRQLDAFLTGRPHPPRAPRSLIGTSTGAWPPTSAVSSQRSSREAAEQARRPRRHAPRGSASTACLVEPPAPYADRLLGANVLPDRWIGAARTA